MDQLKKVTLVSILLIITSLAQSQPILNLGLKGGINNSKMDFNLKNYSSESIVKGHFGMFARAGLGRVFIQPEAYFSAKGGDLSSNIYQTVTSFDFKTFDLPVLLGVKIIKGESIHLHALAGPVFSFLTSKSARGEFTRQYFEDNYVGIQYGLGLDFWFLTLSGRMEHAMGDIYDHPSFSGNNHSFMVSLGIKMF